MKCDLLILLILFDRISMAVAGVIDAKDRIVKANFFMKGLLPDIQCHFIYEYFCI